MAASYQKLYSTRNLGEETFECTPGGKEKGEGGDHAVKDTMLDRSDDFHRVTSVYSFPAFFRVILTSFVGARQEERPRAGRDETVRGNALVT